MAVSSRASTAIALFLLILMIVHLVQAADPTATVDGYGSGPFVIVERHAWLGAGWRRGKTCATGHAEPAALVATVFLRAHPATPMSVLVMPP
ncbi:hypothetical protein AKJ16_DCAP21970 [Drosera capensis]